MQHCSWMIRLSAVFEANIFLAQATLKLLYTRNKFGLVTIKWLSKLIKTANRWRWNFGHKLLNPRDFLAATSETVYLAWIYS